jgi:hypothetical protein
MTNSLKLVEGEFYRTRSGDKVGPLKYGEALVYPWTCPKGPSFTRSGNRYEDQRIDRGDIISQWTETDENVDCILKELIENNKNLSAEVAKCQKDLLALRSVIAAAIRALKEPS